MLPYQGSKVGAIAELEDLISGYPDLGAINAADREGAARLMAAGPDRWFIVQDPGREKLPLWRTQYCAHTSLMRWYADHGKKEKALATGLKFGILMQSGWIGLLCECGGWCCVCRDGVLERGRKAVRGCVAGCAQLRCNQGPRTGGVRLQADRFCQLGG
ncbi:MAG: hypothetical protein DRQ24_07265 [Candidatus Latescibacterota bacterium]|nr:MAG: hypothetical protein DRQ24_07265 [Candidatus Latescibacterota bacterium]